MKAVGFKHAFWNFFEAGHGKEVRDAIGSAVKQAADRLVKYGHDIINAADLVKHVGANGTETKLYEIPVDKIDKNENIIPNLKAVPGTMNLHQIQVCQESPSTISYRDVSCGCDGAFCDNCWKVHSLEKNQHTKGLKHEACVCVLNYSCSVKENIVLSPSYKLDTAAALHTLHLCDSFGLLRHECEALQIHLEPLTGRQRSLSGDKLTLNTFSSELIPTYAQDKTLFAVKVRADGDCLPRSGSVFAYGNDQISEEIRLRIIVESVLNCDYYLNEINLRKGFDKKCTHPHELLFAHAMYSDKFIPGIKFNPREIYEREVMSLTKAKSFMGIWQLFALSSVLRMPIFSMYPNFHGQIVNSEVRNHLHRLILPRVQSCETQAKILWCSTRSNNAFNWLPNHFVPVIPFRLSN